MKLNDYSPESMSIKTTTPKPKQKGKYFCACFCYLDIILWKKRASGEVQNYLWVKYG